ncbi:MAG: ComEC/Rec2 family competence protein [Pontiellaceae bacterium]|nr:ComEC/Rec2 family competence protein [Pontiellaceae bacterium]
MVISGRPLRRPMIGIAVSMVVGICVASSFELRPAFVLCVALLLWFAAFFLRDRRCGSLLVFGVVASVSAVWFGVSALGEHTNSFENGNARLPIPRTEAVGHVSTKPRYSPFKNKKSGMWLFHVRLEGMKSSNVWIKEGGELDVRVMGSLRSDPVAEKGERVWLRGELEEPYRENRSLRLKVYGPDCCLPLADSRNSFFALCQRWRSEAAKRLDVGMKTHPEERAVLRALVLGYRGEIPSDAYARFQRTGLLHIFAISGLHVGMIGILLVVAMKSFGVSRVWFGIFLVPLLFIYVAATGMTESALRALIMAAVFLLAPLFRAKPDVPSAIAFAAALILLFNPYALKSVGFVLSFGIVGFIVMVYSRIPSHWLPRNAVGNYVVSLMITSLAASLASFPLTIYYFGRFSPIALVGNLLVVPLTFCILLSGWLSVLFPPTSIIFNHASLVFIKVMLKGMVFLDQIPGSSLEVSRPHFGVLLLWCGSLIYLLTHASCRRQIINGVAFAGCAAVWTVLGCCGLPFF